MKLDAHVAGRTEVTAWSGPDDSDDVVSCLGSTTGARQDALFELRSSLATDGDGNRIWRTDVMDLTGRRPKRVGRASTRGGVFGDPVRSWSTKVDGTRARWAADGTLEVAGVRDVCTLATRGGAVSADVDASIAERGTELGRDLVGFGARLLGRGLPAERRERREAEEADRQRALHSPDVVDGEVTAFDGWLRAVQHQPEGGAHDESWLITIDRARPDPAPPALTLLVATASLCHRMALVRAWAGGRR